MQKLGKSFEELLSERMVVSDIVLVGVELLNIIERLHNIGFIHNDIKPDNIMIG